MAITVVQTAQGGSVNAGMASATFGSPVTAGNTVIAVLATYPIVVSLSAPTDSKSNVYHTAVTKTQATITTTYEVGIYYAYNVTGGSSFNVTMSGYTFCCCGPSVQQVGITIYEISGLTTTNPLDKTASNGVNNSGTNIPTGTTAATSVANEFLLGAGNVISSNVTNWTVNSPWTNLILNDSGSNFNLTLLSAQQIVSSTGTYSATFTETGLLNAGGAAAIATFTGGASGPPAAATGSLLYMGVGA